MSLITLVFIICFLSFFLYMLSTANHSGNRVEDVVLVNGEVGESASSRTGKELAFVWKKPGSSSEVYVMDIENEQSLRKVVYGNYDYYSPAWVGNDKYIAFVEVNEKNKKCFIKVKNLIEGSTAVVDSCTYELNTYVSSNSDGTLIAYNKIDEESKKSRVFIKNMTSDESSYLVGCQLPKCNYEDKSAQFSLDNKYIYVARRYNHLSENIVSIELSNGKESLITNDESDIKGFTLLDNDYIYFSSEVAGSYVGKKVNTKGGEVQSIGVSNFSSPASNPSKGEIFFTNKSKLKNISFIDLASDRYVSRPLLRSNHSQFGAVLSPDGRKIAYVSAKSGFNEIWVATTNSNDSKQITFLREEVFSPSWSPGGKKIAFLTKGEASLQNSLQVVDVESGAIKTIESEYEVYGRPTWSKDGRHIFVNTKSTENSSLSRISLIDGTTIPVMEGEISISQQLTPNSLYYSTYNNDGVWVATLDRDGTLKSTKLAVEFDHMASPYSWFATDEGIFFLTQQDNVVNLYFIAITNTEADYITSLPLENFDPFNPISAHPEKGIFIFTAQRKSISKVSRLFLSAL